MTAYAGLRIFRVAMALEKEFEFYLKNQESLVKEHHGKIVVIKGEEILGFFEDEISAITETKEKHEMGTFLVQQVAPGEESHTMHFHSRVSFA